VKSDPKLIDELMSVSGGKRQVPVIVDGDEVTVGYGGT
jgi:hypothetical protein